MFIITITGKQLNSELVLKTNTRSRARAAYLLCLENKLDCKVTVEQTPREVKFKGV